MILKLDKDDQGRVDYREMMNFLGFKFEAERVIKEGDRLDTGASSTRGILKRTPSKIPARILTDKERQFAHNLVRWIMSWAKQYGTRKDLKAIISHYRSSAEDVIPLANFRLMLQIECGE